MKRSFIYLLGTVMLFAQCEELDPREPGLLVPKTVDQDPSIPSISVNGTQLHSESFGNPADPMLLVLHGGPGDDYRSLLNCKAFADEGFFVVFYDQRGSGLSKREPKESYTIEIMIDDLEAVISHYRTDDNQKVILLGHSWGAMLATAYIEQYPHAIIGAILCEPGGFVWKDVVEYVDRLQDFRLTSEILNDATYLDQFFTGKETDHAILDYKWGVASATADNITGDEGVAPFWRAGAIVQMALYELGEKEKPDWTKNLNTYTTKILFIYSERNSVYGLAHAQKVSSVYPNVQLVQIDGAGHEMIWSPTGWSNFFPVALNYLNELD